jgi:hypothetical protein
MEPKSYSAPKGRFVIIITFLLVVVAFVMLYFGVNTYFAIGAYVQFFPVGILFIVLVVSYLMSSTGYSISEKELNIIHPIGAKTLALEDIKSALEINKSDIMWSLRTFGVGGVFGFYGKFYNRKFGRMNFYMSQYKNLILIETQSGKKLVISPDKLELLDDLNRYLNQARQ